MNMICVQGQEEPQGLPPLPRRDDQAAGRVDRQQLGGHPVDAAAHRAGLGT